MFRRMATHCAAAVVLAGAVAGTAPAQSITYTTGPAEASVGQAPNQTYLGYFSCSGGYTCPAGAQAIVVVVAVHKSSGVIHKPPVKSNLGPVPIGQQPPNPQPGTYAATTTAKVPNGEYYVWALLKLTTATGDTFTAARVTTVTITQGAGAMVAQGSVTATPGQNLVGKVDVTGQVIVNAPVTQNNPNGWEVIGDVQLFLFPDQGGGNWGGTLLPASKPCGSAGGPYSTSIPNVRAGSYQLLATVAFRQANNQTNAQEVASNFTPVVVR